MAGKRTCSPSTASNPSRPPDLAEPTIKPNMDPEGKIGTLGPDGRYIRSYDIDARPGYKSATNKQPATLFLGYDVHLAVAVAEAVWSANPNHVTIKPAPPGYILALHVAPGATNPGPIGLALALQSLEIAPGIGDYVLDRAYSNKRQSFVRPLHQMDKNVTMDYTSTEINKPKFIKVGTKGQRLLNSTGTLLPPGLPEYMHIPPENAKPKDLTEWYVNRALWRWTRNRKLDNGAGQFSCSQCAGRVTTKAQTRNPDAIPNKAAPFLPIEDEQCCHGMVSITADLLDASQDIPFGTPAHDKSYGTSQPQRENHLHDQGQRRPDTRMVPLLRPSRSHHRRPSPGHRSQPQTNPQGRKNPNPKTHRSGQAQESPADPQEHPRRQPLRTGAARIGTRPAPAAPTVTPTVGVSAPGQPKPAPLSRPAHPNTSQRTPTGSRQPPKTGKNRKKDLTGPLIWDKWTRDRGGGAGSRTPVRRVLRVEFSERSCRLVVGRRDHGSHLSPAHPE